jgi:hypothetical protein
MTTATLVRSLETGRCGRRATQIALCCAAVFTLSGCAGRKVHSFSWATAIAARPNPPVAHGDLSAAGDLAPDFRIEPPSNSGRIFGAKSVPARPRMNSPTQTETADAASATGLVPELSPQDTATAKQQVADSIAIAERNLVTARGRNLLPAQSDIVSKIKVFMTEAREASREGDWARARNLAKKAQILSQDLASSL